MKQESFINDKAPQAIKNSNFQYNLHLLNLRTIYRHGAKQPAGQSSFNKQSAEQQYIVEWHKRCQERQFHEKKISNRL